MIAALLLVPMGVGLASPSTDSTDSEFQTKTRDMRAAHQAFKEARSQAVTPDVNNANANTNTKFGKTKEQILESRALHQKTVLQKIVDLQIAYFERVRDRVDHMPNISDAEKATLDGQITTTISGLNAKKAEIDAASGTDALKTLAKDLRTTFTGYHKIVKAIVDAIHASRVAGAENTAGNRSGAIEAKLDELKAQGKDVTDLKAQLQSAQTLMIDAKTLREARDYKGSVTKLKEAHTIFRTVSQAAKAL